ncbi:ATP-binding protein [Nocardia yunnanensis]|uniref:ATP-binding protein n=1 Tax=Nocardia yunnanensis TaxID=2382165 RepID=UPI001CA3DD57|nr:LuxR C-terminal-related transcriptional regulator [Nocardia yunnanensis]
MAVTSEISTRETEVLALVGEHLSNAEIGARLFISVRTVESHVSSLLRKLELPDRRALAQHAAATRPASPRPAPALPKPLTSFIGRTRERGELAELIKTQRQVTAVGPGGVGKTRLALAVVAEVAAEFADGAWFVDLVPVSSPDKCVVAGTVAMALGLGEQPGRSFDRVLLSALADRNALLVLDNCEHVRDGVAPFVEALLETCPGMSVLATSRARLMVPFERVYTVPPMSLAGEGASDAVDLFMDRATAGGWPPNNAMRDQVAAFCERLDGVALAIELAAARWTTLGLDGLTAGLDDQLRMLEGGARADDRHRSVRAALDWSHELLAPEDRELLRRVAVFMTAFPVDAAAEVSGLDKGRVAAGLARLAEQSLLVVTETTAGTQFRALETIRQYGLEQLDAAGELTGTRAGHLRWCVAEAAELTASRGDIRPRFDTVADDFRAALGWAGEQPDRRADAYRLTRHFAALLFARHFTGESQWRHEQAAYLADDPAAAADLLRHAAAAAGCQGNGDDMYRLYRTASDFACRAGDSAAAAADLATAAASVNRFPGKFEHLPSADEVTALLTEARHLAEATGPASNRLHAGATASPEAVDGEGSSPTTDPADAVSQSSESSRVAGLPTDPAQAARAQAAIGVADAAALAEWLPADPTRVAGARAAIGVAEAAALVERVVASPDTDTAVAEVVSQAERAVELARATRDPLAESAALDVLATAQGRAGDLAAAATTARRRIRVLSTTPDDPAGTHELIDALDAAAEFGLGAGDLPGARRWGRQLAEHPMLAEVGHTATSRLLVADALAGNVDEVLTQGARFLESWQREDCPARAALGAAVAGVRMIHGLRDDFDAEREWTGVLQRLGTPPADADGYQAVFDALLMLHHGQSADALERTDLEDARTRVAGAWLPWYVALHVEAAVITGNGSTAVDFADARSAVTGNPVAAAIVDRAEALHAKDRDRLLSTATTFGAAGWTYQSARTKILAGGEAATQGAADITALGLAPMSAPVHL